MTVRKKIKVNEKNYILDESANQAKILHAIELKWAKLQSCQHCKVKDSEKQIELMQKKIVDLKEKINQIKYYPDIGVQNIDDLILETHNFIIASRLMFVEMGHRDLCNVKTVDKTTNEID